MASNKIFEAIVLAGGLGSRLGPLTRTRPKPLVPIGNYTMLDWNFLMLSSNGITRVIVVLKYMGEQIVKHINRVSKQLYPNLEIIVPEVDSLDTADAVRKVADYIKGDHFIVTMADIITNFDLKKLMTVHVKKGGLATIGLKMYGKSPHHFGVVFTDEKMKIKHFLEKPKGSELHLTKLVFRRVFYENNYNQINSGIYCFDKDILEILEENRDLNDFGKQVFPYLLKNRFPMFGFKDDFYWKDCGRFQHVICSNLEVLNQLNYPYLPKGIQKEGSWFGEHCEVANSTFFKAIALGNKVIIKNDSKVTHTSVNDNTMIGDNCIIENSIIWENVVIGNNVIIRDSIIANDVIIEDNCIIEKHSFVDKGSTIPKNMHIKDNLLNDETRKQVRKIMKKVELV